MLRLLWAGISFGWRYRNQMWGVFQTTRKYYERYETAKTYYKQYKKMYNTGRKDYRSAKRAWERW